MIKWHSTHYKLIMQNPNVSYKALSNLLGVHLNSVLNMSKKLGVKHFKKSFNSGVQFVSFCPSRAVYKISVSHVDIGFSACFEKAVEILDKYLFEVKQGFIKL
tara:strand:- start:99 stop:407 length:309 start_codon:yes stop_codon:yes gene_type:complete